MELKSKMPLKALLLAAQASPIYLIAEYVLFQSSWLFVIPFASVGVLCFVNCVSCKTPFQDERVSARIRMLKFWDSSVVDKCPVCGNPMAGFLQN